MKIIAHKNEITTSLEFVNDATANTDIDGVFVDIVNTKDNNIIIFNSIINNPATIQNIENSNLNNFVGQGFLTLESVLDHFTKIGKRIIINALIGNPLITSDRLEQYTNILSDIIKPYPKNLITVVSVNFAFLLNIKNKIPNKVGTFVLRDNLNYIDVDSYIFEPYMLDATIIKQQVDSKKEIMVYLTNWQELQQTINFFNEMLNNNGLAKTTVDDISVISFYPEITVSALKDNNLHE